MSAFYLSYWLLWILVVAESVMLLFVLRGVGRIYRRQMQGLGAMLDAMKDKGDVHLHIASQADATREGGSSA